jgi:hypothetical protein
MLKLLVLFGFFHQALLPIGLETSDKIEIVAINDNVVYLAINGTVVRSAPCHELKAFVVGLGAQPPEIQFAIRLGYPKWRAGIYVVKIGHDWTMAFKHNWPSIGG